MELDRLVYDVRLASYRSGHDRISAESLRGQVRNLCHGLRLRLVDGGAAAFSASEMMDLARSASDACFTAAIVGGGPRLARDDWSYRVESPVRSCLERLASASPGVDPLESGLSRLLRLAEQPLVLFEDSLRQAGIRAGATHERRICPDSGCCASCERLQAMGWQPAGKMPLIRPGCACHFDLALPGMASINGLSVPSSGAESSSPPGESSESPPWVVGGAGVLAGAGVDVPDDRLNLFDAELAPLMARMGFTCERAVDLLREAWQQRQLSMGDVLDVLLMARAIRDGLDGDPLREAEALEKAIGYGSLAALRESVLVAGETSDVSEGQRILNWLASHSPQIEAVAEVQFDRQDGLDEASVRSWCQDRGLACPVVTQVDGSLIVVQHLAGLGGGITRWVEADGVTFGLTPRRLDLCGRLLQDEVLTWLETAEFARSMDEWRAYQGKRGRRRNHPGYRNERTGQIIWQEDWKEPIQDTSSAAATAQSMEHPDDFWVKDHAGRDVRVRKIGHGKDEKVVIQGGVHHGQTLEEAHKAEKKAEAALKYRYERDVAAQEYQRQRDQAVEELTNLTKPKKGTAGGFKPRDEEVDRYMHDQDGYLAKQRERIEKQLQVLSHITDVLEHPDDYPDRNDVRENWDRWVDAITNPDKLSPEMKADLEKSAKAADKASAEKAKGWLSWGKKMLWDNVVDPMLLGGKSGLGGNSGMVSLQVNLRGVGQMVGLGGMLGSYAVPLAAITAAIKYGGKYSQLPVLKQMSEGLFYLDKLVEKGDQILDKHFGNYGARAIRLTSTAICYGISAGMLAGIGVSGGAALAAAPAFGIGVTAAVAVLGKGAYVASVRAGKAFKRMKDGLMERMERIRKLQEEKRKQKEAARTSGKATMSLFDFGEDDLDMEVLFAEAEEAEFAARDQGMTQGTFEKAVRECVVRYMKIIHDFVKKYSHPLTVLAAIATKNGHQSVKFSSDWVLYDPAIPLDDLSGLVEFDGLSTPFRVRAEFADTDPTDYLAEFSIAGRPDLPGDGFGRIDGEMVWNRRGSLMAGPERLLSSLQASGLAMSSHAVEIPDNIEWEMPEIPEAVRPHEDVVGPVRPEVAAAMDDAANFSEECVRDLEHLLARSGCSGDLRNRLLLGAPSSWVSGYGVTIDPTACWLRRGGSPDLAAEFAANQAAQWLRDRQGDGLEYHLPADSDQLLILDTVESLSSRRGIDLVAFTTKDGAGFPRDLFDGLSRHPDVVGAEYWIVDAGKQVAIRDFPPAPAGTRVEVSLK